MSFELGTLWATLALRDQMSAQVKQAFQNYKDAADSTDISSRTFATSLTNITKLANDFSGLNLETKAQNYAAAVSQVGGASKLTADEQQRVNDVMTEAIAKYAALGQQAPANIQALAEATKGAAEQTSIFDESFVRLTGAFAAGQLVDRMTESIVEFSKSVPEAAVQLVNISNKTGMSVDYMAALQPVAKQAGTTIDEMGQSFFKMGVNIEESNAKTKTGLADLAKVTGDAGYAIDNLKSSGMSLEDENKFILTGLVSLHDQQVANTIGTEIYGRSFNTWAAAVRNGSIAVDASLTPLNEQARAIKAASDALDELEIKIKNNAISGIGNTIIGISGQAQVAFEHIRDAFNLGLISQDQFTKSLGMSASQMVAYAATLEATRVKANESAYQTRAQAEAYALLPPHLTAAQVATKLLDDSQRSLDAGVMSAIATVEASHGSLGALWEQLKKAGDITDDDRLAFDAFGESIRKAATTATQELAAAQKPIDEFATHTSELAYHIADMRDQGLSAADIIKKLGEQAATAMNDAAQYGLSLRQLPDDVIVLGESWLRYQAITSEADLFNLKGLKQSVDGLKALQDEIDKAAKKVADTHAKSIEDTKLLWDDYFVMVAKRSGSTADQQIADANRWLDSQLRVIQTSALSADDAFNRMIVLAAMWGEKITAVSPWKSLVDDLPKTIESAFEGGGGITGALKSLATQVGTDFGKELEAAIAKQIKGFPELSAEIKASGGMAATAALGSALAGGDTGDQIGAVGGVALSASLAAGLATGGTIAGAVALGAATMGIGLAVVGVIALFSQGGEAAKAMAAAVQKFNDSVKATDDTIKASYGTLDNAAALAQRFGVSLRTVIDFKPGTWQAQAEIEDIQNGLKALDDKLKLVDATVQKYKMDWSDMVTMQDRTAAAVGSAQALHDEITMLVQSGYSFASITTGMADAVNAWLASALKAGVQIPPGMQPIVEQLITMHLITQQNADAMLGLASSTMPALSDITAAAGRYGLTLDSLGDKIQQLRADTTFAQMAADFKTLTDAGADAHVVVNGTMGVDGQWIAGMGSQIQAALDAAIQSHSTVSASIKPELQLMSDAGALLDAKGVKTTLEQLVASGTVTFGMSDAEKQAQQTDALIQALQNLTTAVSAPIEAPGAWGGTISPTGVSAGLVGGSPQAPDVHITVQAWDGPSVDDWLRRGGDRQIADAVVTVLSKDGV